MNRSLCYRSSSLLWPVTRDTGYQKGEPRSYGEPRLLDLLDPILVITFIGLIVAAVGVVVAVLHLREAKGRKMRGPMFVPPPDRQCCPNHTPTEGWVYLYWNPVYGLWQCPVAGEYYPPLFWTS